MLKHLEDITFNNFGPNLHLANKQQSGQLYEPPPLLILRSVHFSSFYISLLHHRNRY